MWYPEILNSMSSYMEKFPEEKVSLCSSVIYDKNQTSNSGNVSSTEHPKLFETTAKYQNSTKVMQVLRSESVTPTYFYSIRIMGSYPTFLYCRI